MGGLQNEDFLCKVNHFAQPWNYVEAKQLARFDEGARN